MTASRPQRVACAVTRSGTFAAGLLALACTGFTLSCRTAAPAPRETTPVPAGLAKGAPEAVRVMTWNVGSDSIFPGGEVDRSAAFARILRAVGPDVVCLQEVWRAGTAAAELFDSILPLGEGRGWQQHRFLDNVILSRQPLTDRGSGQLEARQRQLRGHAMALSGEGTPSALYLVCAHFESRTGVEHREKQASLVASQLLRSRTSGVPPAGTPIVVLGDFNAVSGLSTRFVRDLREGRVGGQRGRLDVGPDWDGSDLLDVQPRHNGRGDETWTWRDDASRFPPAALDRILYTGSVVTPVKSFVLDTTAMTPGELAAAGLERDDTLYRPAVSGGEPVYDHLPLVADFLDARLASARRLGRTLLFTNGFEAGVPCYRWSGWMRAGCGPGVGLELLERR